MPCGKHTDVNSEDCKECCDKLLQKYPNTTRWIERSLLIKSPMVISKQLRAFLNARDKMKGALIDLITEDEENEENMQEC